MWVGYTWTLPIGGSLAKWPMCRKTLAVLDIWGLSMVYFGIFNVHVVHGASLTLSYIFLFKTDVIAGFCHIWSTAN